MSKIESQKQYIYPDIDDLCIKKQQRECKFWHDGGLEKKYLTESLQRISINKNIILLDIGCGWGRLLEYYLPYVKEVTAIDPDLARLETTKNLINKLKNNKVIFEFIHSNIQEFETKKKFDCILCAHLIQHVPTTEISIIFDKIRKLLKNEAYLILTTTNCLENLDHFIITDLSSGSHTTVTQDEFNEWAKASSSHLATCHFTEKTLRRLLDNFGFEVMYIKKYNGYPKIRGDNFIFAIKK